MRRTALVGILMALSTCGYSGSTDEIALKRAKAALVDVDGVRRPVTVMDVRYAVDDMGLVVVCGTTDTIRGPLDFAATLSGNVASATLDAGFGEIAAGECKAENIERYTKTFTAQPDLLSRVVSGEASLPDYRSAEEKAAYSKLVGDTSSSARAK